MDAADRPRWSWRRKLALQLALVPVLLLAVEGGTRAWLAATGRAYDGAAARAQLEEIASSMRDEIPVAPETGEIGAEAQALDEQQPEHHVLHPYFGFERARSILVMEDEAARFRRGEFDDTFNVLIVGGSVAGIFGRRGTERLGELLSADPRLAGREIVFFGHGRGSFKQPQQSHLVQLLIALGYRLDVVINLDGFNELALGNKNAWDGVHPLYPSAIAYAHLVQGGALDPVDADLLLDVRSALREMERLAERAVADGRLRSAVLGRATLARAHRIRSAWAAAQQAYGERVLASDPDRAVRGPGFEGGLEEVLELIVAGWSKSSRNLQALCEAHGITYLHVLQPTLHDEGSKVLTEQELAKDNAHQSWIDAVRPGYPMMRAEGERLAASGVNFLDASGVFRDVEETLYFDACHFRASGNEILAEAVGPVLLGVLPR